MRKKWADEIGSKPLLGREVEIVYNSDEYQLVDGGWFGIDASLPYKDERRLLDGLASDDQAYLGNVQSAQDLNRMLNHICAGIVQKVKAHSALDKETKQPVFTIAGIDAILASQCPRIKVLNTLLELCEARTTQKKEPKRQPQEDSLAFVQTCMRAISRLQLLKIRLQTLQDNASIRETKAVERLAHSMRLAPDKGEISDDEYDDGDIFRKTIGYV